MPALLAAADQLTGAGTVVLDGPAEAVRLWAEAVRASPNPLLVLLRSEDGASLDPLHPAHGKRADSATALGVRGGCPRPADRDA